MSPAKAWALAGSHSCPECRLRVEFDAEWYFVPAEGRVVHMLCWWLYLGRKGIVRGTAAA